MSALTPSLLAGPASGGVVGGRAVGLARSRTNSRANNTMPASGTFAPQFIKSGRSSPIGGIEGENDFSGRRYVWVKDAELAFVRGWVVEETESHQLLVQCDDGTVCSLQWGALTYHLECP